MSERSPIFSAKLEGEPIGYVEGSKAFDKFGHLRCCYDALSGNLSDLGNGKIVGHVSLEGKFVGLSWQADKLFPKFDSNPLDGTAETAGVDNKEPKSPASRALNSAVVAENEFYGERPSDPIQTPEVPANAAQSGPFLGDVERVFEMLRERIGLPG